jgi:predicted molibdopterin-dependent oxidoreductase YjgC
LQEFFPLIYTQYNSSGHFRLFEGRLIKVESTPKNYSKNKIKNGQIIALSLKEQMKTSVIKKDTAAPYNDVANNKFLKCNSCVRLSNFSSKEQMKMEVMGIHTKTSDSTTLKGAMDKCSLCGADLPQSK